MKSNNLQSKKYALVFYGVLFLLIAIYSLLSLELLSVNFNSNILLIIAAIFSLYVLIRGFHSYTIDTKGEVITLITKRYDFFSFSSKKEKKIDLPKYKINSYEFKPGLINDDLTLYINSRNSKASVVKSRFTISFLNKEERQKIIAELNKIVETNQFQLESKVA